MSTKTNKTDLYYTQRGMFTIFTPNTPEGEKVWNELAAQNGGNGTTFTIHTPATIYQLKQAGYTVRKSTTKTSKPLTFAEIDNLLTQLEN